MRLVYETSGADVRVGDHMPVDGVRCRIMEIERPHKPESTGRVVLRRLDEKGQIDPEFQELRYFPGVIHAKWIEREDHAAIGMEEQRRMRVRSTANHWIAKYSPKRLMKLNRDETKDLNELVHFAIEHLHDGG